MGSGRESFGCSQTKARRDSRDSSICTIFVYREGTLSLPKTPPLVNCGTLEDYPFRQRGFNHTAIPYSSHDTSMTVVSWWNVDYDFLFDVQNKSVKRATCPCPLLSWWVLPIHPRMLFFWPSNDTYYSLYCDLNLNPHRYTLSIIFNPTGTLTPSGWGRNCSSGVKTIQINPSNCLSI